MSNGMVGPETAGPTIDAMVGVIARLAADDLAGRRIGTEGGQAAAAWLATRLETLGAQVATDSFTIRGTVKELTATPTLRARERQLVHRKDFAEHLAGAYTPHPVSGEWTLEPSFDAARARELAAGGAIGIVLPRGTDEAGWMPKMIAGPEPCALPVLSIRTDLYRQLTASTIITASIPLRTVDVNGTNVYGVFREPAADRLSILLTAHFDGVGDDPEMRFPAAADNASGVAVVLDAAHRLHRLLPPGIGLAVALLDGEEAGAHGSAHHAPRLSPGTTVINLDGAAQLHEAAAVEAGGPAHTLLAALDQAGRHTGVALRARAMPSDNRRYAAHGLAAVGIGMGIPGYQTPAETPDRVDPATLHAAANLITATVLELAGSRRS